MTRDRLNLGVCGVGNMGARHARVLMEIQQLNIGTAAKCRLTGVTDVDFSTALTLARKLGTYAFGSLKDLRTAGAQAVIVAVSTPYHHKVTMEALELGMHVFVEKPIASTVAQAEEMIHLARDRGLVLAVGHVERWNPVIRKIKQFLSQSHPETGPIVHIRCNRQGPFPARMREVGVVSDLVVHDVDIVRFITGTIPKVIYASNLFDDKCCMVSDSILQSGDDYCQMTYALHANWLTSAKDRTITVTCEKGILFGDYVTGKLTFRPSSGSDVVLRQEGSGLRNSGKETEEEEPLRVQALGFISSVGPQRNTGLICSGEEGLDALKVVESILKFPLR